MLADNFSSVLVGAQGVEVSIAWVFEFYVERKCGLCLSNQMQTMLWD